MELTKCDCPENELVEIFLNRTLLEGELVIPSRSIGIVIFAHGSGSSRHSPRNQAVAHFLHKYHIGTLLFDLLTPDEDRHYESRFNIDLLTDRLVNTTYWLHSRSEIKSLPVGYFGASTGAAAALKAAARLKDQIAAVVSRGGRPDLAEEELIEVVSPTLLIVGGNDKEVLKLNQSALHRISAVKKLVTVPGAQHLFEKPSELLEVAKHSALWFEEHFTKNTQMVHLGAPPV